MELGPLVLSRLQSAFSTNVSGGEILFSMIGFGLTCLALGRVMSMMHGAAYLTARTEGELQRRTARCTAAAWAAFVVFCLSATVSTFFVAPFLVEGIWARPLLWTLVALLISGLIYIAAATRAGKHLRAFWASSVTIASLIGLMGLSLYPRMVPSSLDVASHGLTIYNASSTSRTLAVMVMIALVGTPLVIAYTALIYTLFMGKVVLAKERLLEHPVGSRSPYHSPQKEASRWL